MFMEVIIIVNYFALFFMFTLSLLDEILNELGNLFEKKNKSIKFVTLSLPQRKKEKSNLIDHEKIGRKQYHDNTNIVDVFSECLKISKSKRERKNDNILKFYLDKIKLHLKSGSISIDGQKIIGNHMNTFKDLNLNAGNRYLITLGKSISTFIEI